MPLIRAWRRWLGALALAPLASHAGASPALDALSLARRPAGARALLAQARGRLEASAVSGSGRAAAVRASCEAGGALSVQVGGHLRLRWRPEGGSGGAARPGEGLLVRAGVSAGVDEVLFGTDEGVEQLWVVREPEASVEGSVELPEGYGLWRHPQVAELVEVRDGRGVARARLRARAAWDAGGEPVAVELSVRGSRVRVRVAPGARYPVVIDPLWTDAADMVFAHRDHTATLLPTGQVLIAGGQSGASGVAELYDPQAGTFTLTGGMTTYRTRHAATLLPSGKVLLTGGGADEPADGRVHSTAEVYDPATGRFEPMPLMRRAGWFGHTSTLLASGDVLIAGNQDWSFTPILDEIYEPQGGAFVETGAGVLMDASTATLLPSGRVLLVGSGHTSVFDTVTRSSAEAPATALPRGFHTATLLGSGRVLLAGNRDAGQDRGEEYAEGQGGVLIEAPMRQARHDHRAVRLPSGRVLLVGGTTSAEAEAYVPERRVFVEAGQLALPRLSGHTATLLASGRVLVAGGLTEGGTTARAELFDPEPRRTESAELPWLGTCNLGAVALGAGAVLAGGLLGTSLSAVSSSVASFEPSNGLFSSLAPLRNGRELFATAALPSGEVMVVGGWGVPWLTPAELLDPGLGASRPSQGDFPIRVAATVLPGGDVVVGGGDAVNPAAIRILKAGAQVQQGPPMLVHREQPAAALLPSGEVLYVGGHGKELRGEIFDPANPSSTRLTKGAMAVARFYPAAVPVVVDGKAQVLLVGGFPYLPLELYDPETESFSAAGKMAGRVDEMSATLLPSGQVLLAGGTNGSGPVDTAELFDPQTRVFKPSAGRMIEPRKGHRAVALADGRVLLSGSCDPHREVRSVELYDPTMDAFAQRQAPWRGRQFPSATLLPSGQVLLAGGSLGGATASASAELLAADASASSEVGPMLAPRRLHTATQMPGGDVLLVGGGAGAEVFRWKEGAFAATSGAPVQPREQHGAVLLGSGRVLLAGGVSGQQILDSAEEYDPVSGQFRAVGAMKHRRHQHAMARLPSGKVLVVGGNDEQGLVKAAEVYDPRSGRFEEAGELPVPASGDPPLLSVGATQPSTLLALGTDAGGAVVAGHRNVVRFDPEAGSLQLLASGPDMAFALAPTPLGEALVCGGSSCLSDTGCRVVCAPYSLAAGALLTPSAHGVGDKGAWGTRLASGDVLLASASLRASGYSSNFSLYRLLPPDVLRPSLDLAQTILAPGERARLPGSRLRAPAVAGASPSLPPDEAPPAVVFVPVASAENVAVPVEAWGDDWLDVRWPRSSQHGPGWLHVLVGGVPSEGRYAELLPVAQGGGCGQSGECATGFCAEGVCCDRACSGGCDSCVAARQADGGLDGRCGPVRQGLAARSGCDVVAAEVCSPSGACDGRGGCELPPTSTACATAEGEAGRCFGGLCVRPPPAQCDETGAAAVQPDGERVECAPMRCRGGVCLSRCASRVDCAPGLRCAEGRCEEPLGPEPVSGCGGCAQASGPAGAGLPLLAALSLLAARGRRSAAGRRRRAAGLGVAALLGAAQARAQAPGASAAPAAPSAQAAARREEAKAEFQRGLGFFAAGNVERALEAFVRSRALSPSKGNTLNAAVCLEKLGRLDEALDLYEEAVASFSASFDPDDQRDVPAAIDRLRAGVGFLDISADALARVVVDGRPRGALPLSAPLRLLPGPHLVRLLLSGYAAVERTVQIGAGKAERLDVRMEPLPGVGALRVEEPQLEGASVFVDGAPVGRVPWEGLLPSGPHAVWAEQAGRGSAPARVVVVQGQTTLLRPRHGPLGRRQRIEVEPRTARISLDGAPLGSGAWEGALPQGSYTVEVFEEGYRTARLSLRSEPGDEADPPLRVSLAIDPAHPRWPARPAGAVRVEAAAGLLVGASLHSSAEQDCRPSCARSTARGALARAGVAYEFPWGGAVGVAAGYLGLTAEIQRTRFSEHGAVPGLQVRYAVTDRTTVRGPWLGLSVGQRTALRGAWALAARLTGGLLLSRSADPVQVLASVGAESAPTLVQGAAQPAQATVPLGEVELGLGRSWGGWGASVSLGALFVPVSGPRFSERGSVSVAALCDPSRPGSVACAADWGALRGERAYGPFVVAHAALTLGRSF